MKLTASNLVHAIMALGSQTWFNYVNVSTTTKVRVVRADGPEGPIVIERKGTDGVAKTQTISVEMLWRAANSLVPGIPVNFDRIFAGSYNTRSALEALLAHTEEFYWCKPGRIEVINGSSAIKAGHKHLVWRPDLGHRKGIIDSVNDVEAVSELPMQMVAYDALIGLEAQTTSDPLPIEVKRRHLQIQIALVEIGSHLGFRSWVAQNDKGYKYGKKGQEKAIGEMDNVIATLNDERTLQSYADAVNAAKLIDCIWFKNGRFIPAVMEVEHSTGVTSGLNRMKKFQELAPALEGMRFVIVAADEDRDEVIYKANAPQFATLKPKFFPYSAVEELHSLCRRRNVSGVAVTPAFIDCFMENCLKAA